MNRTSENGSDVTKASPLFWLRASQPLLNQLFADSLATSWNIPLDVFAAALERSARKHFAQEPEAAQLTQYLSALHLQDLALACACSEGSASAWDHFVSAFRGYLRSAAAAILRCPPDSPASRELADSLFADLYGLSATANRRSLFRYFHGRSSLKTWLRAVLAQRHIDSLRASRRFTEIDSTHGHVATNLAPPVKAAAHPSASTRDDDPHRPRLLAHFRRALDGSLALLEPRDKERLRLYYAADHTLAEIGRKLGEHESSVSRNLERTRRTLRHQVEQALRQGASSLHNDPSGHGLSDAQIALCFEYASEVAAHDLPIDLDQLLPERQAVLRKPGTEKP